jgi:uncharacterized protein (DUF1800 family)
MRIARGLAALTLSLCHFAYAAGVVAIYPSPSDITPGSTKQFTIYNTTSGTGVTWSVNGITGGSSMVGTVTQGGLYTAPMSVPASNVVTVTATSVPSGISGSSAVTVHQPVPIVWSTYPSSTTTGNNITVSLNGSNFQPISTVTVGGMPWIPMYVSATSMKITGNFTAAGTYAVVVTNPGNGARTSSPVSITVTTAAPQPISVSVSPASANVQLSATAQFTATVTNTSNTAVTWSATAGSISTSGLYTAPTAMPPSQVVTITATSQADPTKQGTASALLQAAGGGGGTPGNNSADLHAGRFLEQAAFGPSPMDLNFIHQNTTASIDGIDAWLANQFAMSPSVIGMPAQSNTVQSDTLHRIATAPDQLRQKMAWALGTFIVISMNKNIYPNEYVPYQQILANDAFGNFRTLLWDITVSPQMGKYLDLANSNKAGVGGGANENYARELMQLFTIGLNMLNPDGSPVLDGQGKPVPTYLQPDVVRVAAALTGWTYPTAAGATPQPNNWENFSASQMETRQGNHDVTAKTLINGCSLPAGQTVVQDTNGVLDCVFNHPNAGPFVATRLIRALVTSNPTPGYIQRVATVFNNNGSGVRGDLKAVLTAILKDPEARQDTVTVDAGGNPFYVLNGANVNYTPGRLKNPIYFITSFVRAMNGTIPAGTVIPWNFVAMGETVVQPPSVFYYYSPLYHLPLNPVLFGPEFQIYTPTESVEEANMVAGIINQPNSDPSIDLSAFNAVVTNTPALLDLADQKFYYGRMPAQIRSAIATAIDANTDNPSRVFTAVYLSALAGQYQTQY